MAVCPDCKEKFYLQEKQNNEPENELEKYHNFCKIYISKCSSCGLVCDSDKITLSEEDKEFFISQKLKDLKLEIELLFLNAYESDTSSRLEDLAIKAKTFAYFCSYKNDYEKMILAFNEYAFQLYCFARKNVEVFCQVEDVFEDEKNSKALYEKGITPIIDELNKTRNTIISAIDKHFTELSDKRMFKFIKIENLFYLKKDNEAKKELEKLNNVSKDLNDWLLEIPKYLAGRFEL